MSQIFKDKVDIQILIEFLDRYCTKTNSMYEINNIVFKKFKFEKEHLNKFYQDIEPFYHNLNLNTLKGIEFIKILSLLYVKSVIYFISLTHLKLNTLNLHMIFNTLFT